MRVKSLGNTLFHLQHRQDNGEDVAHLVSETKAELESEHRHIAEDAKIRVLVRGGQKKEKPPPRISFVQKSLMRARSYSLGFEMPVELLLLPSQQ